MRYGKKKAKRQPYSLPKHLPPYAKQAQNACKAAGLFLLIEGQPGRADEVWRLYDAEDMGDQLAIYLPPARCYRNANTWVRVNGWKGAVDVALRRRDQLRREKAASMSRA
jgi:hypothetical protein